MVQTARNSLNQTVALLTWLEQQGTAIADLTQPKLEGYLDEWTRHTATTLHPFGCWLNRTGINTSIRIDYIAPTAQVAMSDADR